MFCRLLQTKSHEKISFIQSLIKRPLVGFEAVPEVGLAAKVSTVANTRNLTKMFELSKGKLLMKLCSFFKNPQIQWGDATPDPPGLLAPAETIPGAR